jgi:hypothetical protein
MSENQKSRRGTSAEITLELVAQTVFKLNELFPNSTAIHGDVLANLGQEAIKYLSIWARQLENEKRTGAAAKRAEELLDSWQAESEEDDRTREKIERESRQKVDWATISRAQEIPFGQVAKVIWPKNRDRITRLEHILTIMEKESPPHERRKGIWHTALKNKSVPECLIPEVKASGDIILKRYKSQIAKEHGRRGGIKRAEKYSTNKKAAENDSSKTASSGETGSRALER